MGLICEAILEPSRRDLASAILGTHVTAAHASSIHGANTSKVRASSQSSSSFLAALEACVLVAHAGSRAIELPKLAMAMDLTLTVFAHTFLGPWITHTFALRAFGSRAAGHHILRAPLSDSIIGLVGTELDRLERAIGTTVTNILRKLFLGRSKDQIAQKRKHDAPELE